MIKRIGLFFFALFLCIAGVLDAKDVNVRGYTRKDGTYVAPHVRTSPNSTKSDNYSTKGNVNPYTGKEGTKPGDAAPAAPKASPEEKKTPAATEKTPVLGWLGVKSGLSDVELIHQMGAPKVVEQKADFEIWTYPTGVVFVKEKKVVAWKQDRSA